MDVSTYRMQQYRRLVDRFEQVARQNLENLVHVADLCEVAGVNQRTLSRAFREVRGMGPARYVQQLRLAEARRVLLREEGTVTKVAMRFGFGELGNFGALYRKAFGESPSDTRRRRRSMDGELEREVSIVPYGSEQEETDRNQHTEKAGSNFGEGAIQPDTNSETS